MCDVDRTRPAFRRTISFPAKLFGRKQRPSNAHARSAFAGAPWSFPSQRKARLSLPSFSFRVWKTRAPRLCLDSDPALLHLTPAGKPPPATTPRPLVFRHSIDNFSPTQGCISPSTFLPAHRRRPATPASPAARNPTLGPWTRRSVYRRLHFSSIVGITRVHTHESRDVLPRTPQRIFR